MSKREPKPLPGDPDDPQGMAVLRDRFLEFLSVHNYSARTVEVRRIGIGWFIRWAEPRGVIRPGEVSRPVLERYQRHLHYQRKKNGDPLSASCQYSRLSSLKMWFKWLAKERFILYNPADELELPKVNHRLPKHVLTASEAERIMATTDIHDPLGLRDRAILETFYSTGIRRLELLSLKLYDIDADRGTVTIRHGKGDKERVIPIGDRALAWIDRYLQEVRPGLLIGNTCADVLFLTNRGTALQPTGVSKIIHDYVVAADIGKKGSCHLFRHTMATLMLEGGAEIRYIQEMLGHSRLTTTQIYTQVSIRKLKEIHTATHPAKMHRLGQ